MAYDPSASRPSRREERNVPPGLQGLVTRVLRSGVVLGSALLLVGIVLEAIVGRGSLLASPAPSSGRGFTVLLQQGGAPVLVLVGILVLVATPLTRVAISTALFSAARDRTFAVITLFVLAILGATLVTGVLR